MTQKNHLRWLAFASLLAAPQWAFAGAGAANLKADVMARIVPQAFLAFFGLAILMMFYYGFKLTTEAQTEAGLTNAAKSFVNALFGFAVIALAYPFANAFLSGVPNVTTLGTGLSFVTSYIIFAAEGIFALMVTINGMRMIISQGDSGEIEKARKALLTNIGGAILMFLSGPIMTAVAGGSPGAIIDEAKGLAFFVMTIIGCVSLIALIVAGAMLIVSVDESLKERAKKTVIGTLISLAVVLASYSLIKAFL